MGAPSRVAIVNGSSRFSGVTLSVIPYLEALERMGLAVRWYQCADRGKNSTVRSDEVTIGGAGLSVESVEMGLNRLLIFPYRLRQMPEDVILLGDPSLAYVGGSHARRIVLVHDLLPLTEYADRTDARLMFYTIIPKLRQMTGIIVSTSAMRGELARYGIDPRRMQVIPYTHGLGIHPEHVERSVERVRRTRTLRVLYVGTDRPFKNVGFVLELARALGAAPGGVTYSFTLLSQLRPSTIAKIGHLGLRNVRVFQRVPSAAEMYEECDVLVYPSLHEGFGRPIIEALAFGIPIVANRIPPFVEILGQTGIVRSVDAPHDWIATLKSLTDPETLRAQARRSLELSEQFSPERFYQRVSAALRTLLEGRPHEN